MLFNLTPINNYTYYDRSRCFIYITNKNHYHYIYHFLYFNIEFLAMIRESETRQERKRKKIGNLAERKFFHLAKKKKNRPSNTRRPPIYYKYIT